MPRRTMRPPQPAILRRRLVHERKEVPSVNRTSIRSTFTKWHANDSFGEPFACQAVDGALFSQGQEILEFKPPLCGACRNLDIAAVANDGSSQCSARGSEVFGRQVTRIPKTVFSHNVRNRLLCTRANKRWRFCTIPTYDDTVSVHIVKLTFSTDSRNFPMEAKGQGEWMPRSLRPLKRWCSLLALASGIASPATSIAQGTPEARQACTPEAFRLCSAHIPNADEVAACLRERNAELSDACRKFVAAGTTPPERSDNVDARKRIAR